MFKSLIRARNHDINDSYLINIAKEDHWNTEENRTSGNK